MLLFMEGTNRMQYTMSTAILTHPDEIGYSGIFASRRDRPPSSVSVMYSGITTKLLPPRCSLQFVRRRSSPLVQGSLSVVLLCLRNQDDKTVIELLEPYLGRGPRDLFSGYTVCVMKVRTLCTLSLELVRGGLNTGGF